MTTTSGGLPGPSALAAAHGADLHRLAAMLTADTEVATELVARVLRQAGPVGQAPDRLRTELVRRYLRTAPRRVEVVDVADVDAGQVLHGLHPRARAAAALRLGEGWDAERTASALRVPPRRVRSLVPEVPDLDLALAGVADQYALSGSELQAALAHRLADLPPGQAPQPSGWRWAVAGGVLAALVLGYVVDRPEGAAPVAGGAPLAAAADVDLTSAGWKLDKEGEPPRSVLGLVRRETVTVPKGQRRVVASLPEVSNVGTAAFGVLWCDMPPAQDDHLRVPAGTLTVDGSEITLPCAGQDGSPPVSRVVSLPAGQDGVLEISGDMPGDGTAVLGLYTESDDFFAPAARGDLTDAPPADAGALVLDAGRGVQVTRGRSFVEAVEVSHDTTIEVWAGRTGAVAVNVDGIPATDDGDVASWMTMLSELTPGQLDGREPMTSDPSDYVDWSAQESDLREGRWLVSVPGQVRTFELPEQVRPAPGEHRTVSVEVVTENVGDRVQVSLASAASGRVDTAPLQASADPVAPEFVLGHRLLGEWQVPSDGHLRELIPAGSEELPDDVRLMLVHQGDTGAVFGWGEAAVGRGEVMQPLWFLGEMEWALGELRSPWFEPPPPGSGPLRVSAPPVLDHRPATVLAYAPVPYEEFDFGAADVPPGSWPKGATQPENDGRYVNFSGWPEQGTAGPDDLEDGRITLDVEAYRGLAARITTEGRGRMRFLLDGEPVNGLQSTDGWWSSWTGEAVTSETELVYPGGVVAGDVELTVVVEDYEDFTIELHGG